MRRLGFSGAWVLLFVLALAPAIANSRRGRAGAGRRGAARGSQRGELPAGQRRLLPRHGQRRATDAGRGQGPQYVDRLDRRQRPLLGQRHQGQPRNLRYPQGHHLASEPDLLRRSALRPRFALALARRAQRTLLREADRLPTRSGSGFGSTCAAPTARPIRSRTRRNTLASRSARAATTFKDGSTLPVGSYFGYATGIVGLRLFPNPDFDQAAKDKWDPDRYYTDPNYYNDPNLVRPYRVGMACGFCHVGPSPDPSAGQSGSPAMGRSQFNGRQPVSMDRPRLRLRRRCEELPLSARPYLRARHGGHLAGLDRLHQQPAHHERGLSARPPSRRGEALGQGDAERRRNSTTSSSPGFFDPPDTSWSPRVLKDGSDSVGVLGALNRVYLNIGLYSEEWMRHFNPFFGGKPITPIEIATAEKNSAYWRATEAGTPFMAEIPGRGRPAGFAREGAGRREISDRRCRDA